MPVTVDEFRGMLATSDSETIAREIFLNDDCAHVTAGNRALIKHKIAASYNIPIGDMELCVTGSAKLGFSIVTKHVAGINYPRYRAFSEISDVDCAIISRNIFEKVWHELTNFAHGQSPWPWAAGRLGDYMICGWLRPDHFPNRRLAYCDSWWDTFRALSVSSAFNRRKVRGALFYSRDHLIKYLQRSINECKAEL